MPAFLLALQLASAGPVGADTFKLCKEYSDALVDERVKKLPEAKRLPAIAKNFKVTQKKLEAALGECEQAGGVEKIVASAREAVDAKLTGLPAIKSNGLDAAA